MTSEDDGGRLAVSVGDGITVTLPETATTGYRWEPDIVGAGVVRVVGAEPDASATPRGAPGQRVIGFEVVASGATQLRLVRKRSWEDAVKERFTLDLDARDA